MRKVNDVRDWSIRGAKLVGSVLMLCIIEHCCAKKGLKSSVILVKIGNKIAIVV